MSNLITRKQIQRNPDILFIFGDNDERKGLGGMAKEFRGEANSIGIRTKKKPSNYESSFYTDIEYIENTIKIIEDIKIIREKMKKYIGICLPEGIGTGLSELDKRCPNTYLFLQNEIEILKRDFIK